MMHLKDLNKKEKQWYRFLEMIPGGLVWATFILAIVLSFIKPLWVIYFVIVFSLFWLFRVIYFIFYLIISWIKHKRAVNTDWMAKVREVPEWEKIYHMVFLPTYRESLDVLRSTLDSIVANSYPLDKFIIVLAGEERAKDDFLPKAEILRREYGDKFFKFLTTIHPDNVPGEVKGKGANANYAGRQAKKLVDDLEIPYENIIVSYFDCDTCAHPQYFSCVAYKYLTHPNPTKTSYQPIALYNNNIWESMAFMRVAAFGTTFWLMTELSRPDRLFTFSSHSMSFRALVDVDFWQKDIVTDDSRIFLQCFMRYNGNYSVTPIFVPVSMDTVMADGAWESLKSLYKQQRRWAWGVEHFPYMVRHFKNNKNISAGKKAKYLWNHVEGMYSWATAPILLFVLGRLPFWLAPNSIQGHTIIQNAPFTIEKLMALAMLGIMFSAVFCAMLLPPRKGKIGFTKRAMMILQWLFLPITLVLFGSLPAVESQTRLMLGKYLGFFVTPKERK